MTGFDTLQHLGLPCAKRLSVAGFLDLSLLFPRGEGLLLEVFLPAVLPLFPLGAGFIPEPLCLLVYLGFLTFLRLLTVMVRTSRDSHINNIMRNRRPGTGSMSRNEQYVHRRREERRRECSTLLPRSPTQSRREWSTLSSLPPRAGGNVQHC